MVRRHPGVIVALAIAFSFTPFFSPFPISSDLQPLYLFFMLAVISASAKMWRITPAATALLCLAVIYCFYVDISNPHFDFRKAIGLFAAFFAYHFFCHHQDKVNQKLLFYIVAVNFCAVLFHYLAPDLFSQTLGLFVRKIKSVSMEGQRGASGFAAESSFMGTLAVFFIVVSFLLRDRGDRGYCWLNVLLSVLIVFMTRSGSGFLFLFIFLAAYFFKPRAKYILIGSFVLMLIVFFAYNFDAGRGGYVIRALMDNPNQLFLVDASIGHRVINIVTGVLSVFHSPFGVGSGGYDRAFITLDSMYGVTDEIEGRGSNISAFALYSVELGIIYWIVMIYFVFLAFRRQNNVMPYILFAIMMHAVSFSVAFPPVWFLFATLHSRTKPALSKRGNN